jgi:hypothetical protein
LSSVIELQANNSIERNKLMQAVSSYMGQLNVKAALVQEPVGESADMSSGEPVIQLKNQRIDSIRLVQGALSACGDNGEPLRFQYKIVTPKKFSNDFVNRLKARTKTLKTGKTLGLFGGKIVGVKWIGRELADILNQDREISAGLLHCAQIWGEGEFEIQAAGANEVYVASPWFINSKTIIALYSSTRTYDEQECVLGYKIADQIAGLISGRIQDILILGQGKRNVTHQP